MKEWELSQRLSPSLNKRVQEILSNGTKSCVHRDWNTVRGSYGAGLDQLKETLNRKQISRQILRCEV